LSLIPPACEQVRLRAWVHNANHMVPCPRQWTGQPRVTTCSNLDMACSLIWAWHIYNGKTALLKARLKGEKLLKCLGTLRGLVLGGRPVGLDWKVALVISHMSFTFAIDFMFGVPGPCESLRRLREMTVWLEHEMSLHFSLSISFSVVLTQMVSLCKKNDLFYQSIWYTLRLVKNSSCCHFRWLAYLMSPHYFFRFL
jgi:hypothetical protein